MKIWFQPCKKKGGVVSTMLKFVAPSGRDITRKSASPVEGFRISTSLSLKNEYCAAVEPRGEKRSFLFALGRVFAFMALAFFLPAGNAWSQKSCDSIVTPYDHSEQKKVLEKFYHKTDGENWNNTENWLTHEDFGAWYGVNKRVINRISGCVVAELHLQENNLSGPIPTELGELDYPGLKVLVSS